MSVEHKFNEVHKFKMNVDFTTIEWGTDSSYQSASKMLINTSEQWCQVWQVHTYNTEPPPPIPQVDFTCYKVVAVFAGEKPTSGYSIEIIRVETNDSQTKEKPSLTFTLQYCQPKAGDFVTEALTYPYHMIKVPKLDSGKIAFRQI